MSIVPVRINGRDYHIACDDGEEEHLRLLADEVDERVRALVFRMGSNPGEAMALVLTALTMADEAIENKKEMEAIAKAAREKRPVVEEPAKEGIPDRMVEIENAMATTLEEIALRIEKIAQHIEVS